MKIELKPLKEQVIVITGASSGIGLTTARMAAKKGAKVVVAARNEDALQQLTAEIKSNGGQAAYAVADVGKEEDVQRIAETAISEFGGFDTWVNNAGISIFGKAEEVTIEDMKRMFDTNYWGAVYGSRIAVKHFKEHDKPGALINVGSFFGDRATVIQGTYSTAKHALHGWTDVIRMELEKEEAPISVSLIKPGRIDTPYNEHARSYLEKQPSHRGMVYPPESVAEAIIYCAANPKREMYVGFQSKFLVKLAGFAPRFTDKLMEAWMFYSQHDDRPSRSREDSALFKPGYGMHQRGTNAGWTRPRSIYVKAQKHPLLATLAVVGGAALATLVFSNKGEGIRNIKTALPKLKNNLKSDSSNLIL